MTNPADELTKLKVLVPIIPIIIPVIVGLYVYIKYTKNTTRADFEKLNQNLTEKEIRKSKQGFLLFVIAGIGFVLLDVIGFLIKATMKLMGMNASIVVQTFTLITFVSAFVFLIVYFVWKRL